MNLPSYQAYKPNIPAIAHIGICTKILPGTRLGFICFYPDSDPDSDPDPDPDPDDSPEP